MNVWRSFVVWLLARERKLVLLEIENLEYRLKRIDLLETHYYRKWKVNTVKEW